MTARRAPAVETVELATLIHDPALYPRRHVNERHVTELADVLKAGHALPEIIACRRSRKIVDGAHRRLAAERAGHNTIAVEFRDYPSEKDLFADALSLNATHGLSLDTTDKIHAAEVGSSLGIEDTDLAALLRTSLAHLRSITKRYANVQEALAELPELRKVAPVEYDVEELRKVGTGPQELADLRRVILKASVRHLEGQQVTQQQAQVITSGLTPGPSYLLIVRQLAAGIEHNLLPSKGNHPTLHEELSRLRGLLVTAGF